MISKLRFCRCPHACGCVLVEAVIRQNYITAPYYMMNADMAAIDVSIVVWHYRIWMEFDCSRHLWSVICNACWQLSNTICQLCKHCRWTPSRIVMLAVSVNILQRFMYIKFQRKDHAGEKNMRRELQWDIFKYWAKVFFIEYTKYFFGKWQRYFLYFYINEWEHYNSLFD